MKACRSCRHWHPTAEANAIGEKVGGAYALSGKLSSEVYSDNAEEMLIQIDGFGNPLTCKVLSRADFSCETWVAK